MRVFGLKQEKELAFVKSSASRVQATGMKREGGRNVREKTEGGGRERDGTVWLRGGQKALCLEYHSSLCAFLFLSQATSLLSPDGLYLCFFLGFWF